METTDLITIMQQFGQWAVFFYLFMRERSDHERTRRAYREDLRDMAGMGDRLPRYSKPINPAS